MSRKNGTTQSSRLTRSSMAASNDTKLRYRALLEDLSTIEDDVSSNTECMERTANAVREAQALLAEGSYEEKARNPGVGYLDSRVLKATSDLAVRCSETVSGNANVYDRHELAQHMRENPEFWTLMFPREVPQLSYLFGTFAPAPPELRARAPRRRVERQALAALKAPETVDKLDKTEEGSEMVIRVNRFIMKTYRNSGKPLSYFHVVLDPESFSRTVENVYHVSFLVKDGLVSVQCFSYYDDLCYVYWKFLESACINWLAMFMPFPTIVSEQYRCPKLKAVVVGRMIIPQQQKAQLLPRSSGSREFSRTVENVYHVSFLVNDGLVSVQVDEDNGLPFITPVPETQRERHDLADENQFIVSIDMQRWQDLVGAFRIQKPMMVLKR